MSVEVANEAGAQIEEAEFAALGRFVIDAMNVHPQAELSILFVTEPVMSELHQRWMGEPGPTDVLSFPMDELRPGDADDDGEPGMLGDVVICPAVAEVQAKAAGHSAAEEMELLAVHGILHLLGFDHAEKEEEKEMFALQRKLLLSFLATRRSR